MLKPEAHLQKLRTSEKRGSVRLVNNGAQVVANFPLLLLRLRLIIPLDRIT